MTETLSGMTPLSGHVTSFRIPVQERVGEFLEMRLFFEQSKELLSFCDHILKENVREANLRFDRENYREKEDLERLARSLRYGLFDGVSCIDRCLAPYKKGLYVLTDGSCRGFFRYLDRNGFSLAGIAGSLEKEEAAGFPIVDPSVIRSEDPIFIAMFDSTKVKEAKELLRARGKEQDVITFFDMDLSSIPMRKELLSWYRS